MIKNLILTVFITASLSLLFQNTGSLHAMDLDNIIAYPVPFNLNTHKFLRIGYKPGVTGDNADRITVQIYDINGDQVFTRTYTSMDIIWNGRNGKGKQVKPGLYIIKVSLENSQSGDFGQKTLRILVKK